MTSSCWGNAGDPKLFQRLNWLHQMILIAYLSFYTERMIQSQGKQNNLSFTTYLWCWCQRQPPLLAVLHTAYFDLTLLQFIFALKSVMLHTDESATTNTPTIIQRDLYNSSLLYIFCSKPVKTILQKRNTTSVKDMF